MANNCLVTKLKGSVDKVLPVFGQSYFEFVYNEGSEQGAYGFAIASDNPIELEVEGTYFTDSTGSQNLGTKIFSSNTANVYVKGPSNCKVFVKNKYGIKIFQATTVSQNLDTLIKILNETFEWSVDCTKINIGQGFATSPSSFTPSLALARLIKLAEFTYRNFRQGWIINDLAEAQIANGRDYTTNPTLKLSLTTTGQIRYFNGTANVAIPNSVIYIVFKSGGYELHSQTADGTLLYDSLA